MFRFVFVALQLGAPEARLGSGVVDLTANNFEAFIAANRRVMVDFVNSSAPSEETNELMEAIRKIRNYGSKAPVARVDAGKDPDLVRRFVGTVGCDEASESQKCGEKLPQLLWFLNGQPTQYHRHLRTSHNIMSFVLALDRDPMSTVEDESNLDDWDQVVFAKLPKQSSDYRTLEAIASKHMDSVAFVHQEHAGASNITWVTNGSMRDYYEGEMESERLSKWIHEHIVFSEDIPASPVADDGSVIVVGKTFDELVLRGDRDVMLMVYAPWCGFSRKVMPAWGEFARSATGLEGISVAKMDGTRNRSPIPGLSWTTFPTIVFFRRGEQQFKVFEGAERTAAAFQAFAQQHGTSTFTFLDEAEITSMLQSTAQLKEL